MRPALISLKPFCFFLGIQPQSGPFGKRKYRPGAKDHRMSFVSRRFVIQQYVYKIKVSENFSTGRQACFQPAGWLVSP